MLCFPKRVFLSSVIFLAVGLTSVSFSESVKEESLMSHELCQSPSMKIIGISCRTSNAEGEGSNDIGALWEKFFNEEIQEKIPNVISGELVALYCDYEKDHTAPYTCVIGCKVSSFDEVPEGMVAKEIPASTYAKYPVQGEFPHSLIHAWKSIWGSDLNRTYTGDFEVYGEGFFKPEKEMDIYIAVEK